jgi:serine/threonine protein kinase
MHMNQTSPNSLKAGDVVARRYVILRHLRDEPCGGVWLAQDRSLGVDVGLKFMPRRSPTFETVREALRREGALALKLRHPHILLVVHFDEGEEGVYLIQEAFQGEPLLAHLNRLERFRVPYALNLLEQVSKALAYFHQFHEVHHSLDPSNLLLNADTVKLTNFACSPPQEEETQVTRLELRAYVAPEVIQGEPLSPASNVFSLGVLGFRLAAGSLPYSLTFDEALPYRLENMPADLEEIPLPLQNLLLQCLAPDPRDRFEDAGAFLAALEQRRESFRTPTYGRRMGWNPALQRQAAGVVESVSRFCGQFWEGSKGAAGKVTERIQSLSEHEDPGFTKRVLIGISGTLLALILIIWGAWAMLHKTEIPSAPLQSVSTPSAPETPKESEAKPPQAGVPPLKAGSEAAHPPAAHVVSKPAATPAAPKETKATPAPKEHYQLWVVTYHDYGDALLVKKKIQAKNIPVKVYRGAYNKKVYFAVKAGPFTSKKQAEDVASRLKSGLKLSQTPKLVKIKNEAPKTSLSKANR